MLANSSTALNAGHRFVILTGPSCAGKTPLVRTLARVDPGLYGVFKRIVPVTSRSRRPHETDGIEYHFRSREDVEALRTDPRYIVARSRDDVQAVDIALLQKSLSHTSVLYEGNPHTALQLLDHRLIRSPRLGIFLSPLSRGELVALKTAGGRTGLRRAVTDLVRDRLLRRAERWRVPVGGVQQEDVEARAAAAFDELREAWRYQFVIANHDGEDSSHWDAGPLPAGDALRTYRAFVSLLLHGTAPEAEQWEEDLLPP